MEANPRALLDELGRQIDELGRRANLADAATRLRPIADLAAVVKEARKAQGLTLEALAELAEIGFSTAVKLESGKDGVRLESVLKVASALGLKVWIG